MSLSPSHQPTSPARAAKCQKLLKKGRNTFCPSARNAPPNLAKSNKASTNPKKKGKREREAWCFCVTKERSEPRKKLACYKWMTWNKELSVSRHHLAKFGKTTQQGDQEEDEDVENSANHTRAFDNNNPIRFQCSLVLLKLKIPSCQPFNNPLIITTTTTTTRSAAATTTKLSLLLRPRRSGRSKPLDDDDHDPSRPSIWKPKNIHTNKQKKPNFVSLVQMKQER